MKAVKEIDSSFFLTPKLGKAWETRLEPGSSADAKDLRQERNWGLGGTADLQGWSLRETERGGRIQLEGKTGARSEEIMKAYGRSLSFILNAMRSHRKISVREGAHLIL